MDSRSALKLYIECMNCANTPDQCPGILKDIAQGIPPRGFYFQSVPVKLLIVGKNPGHPLQGEPERYKGLNGKKLFEAYRRFQNVYYSNPDASREPSSRFHKNLFRYLSFFLDVPQHEIYAHAAYTNLVKCSTRNEQARLDPTTMNECFERYFLNELRILRPKVLLALGREVESFLESRKRVHGLPVIYIRHPSYRYARTVEQRVLTGIKNRIQRHI